MLLNDVYRRVRFRADDPMRYLHVPRRLRADIDEPPPEPKPNDRIIDLAEVDFGEVVPEPDLV